MKIKYEILDLTNNTNDLQAGDMDRTLADLNISTKCMLIAVVKAANA